MSSSFSNKTNVESAEVPTVIRSDTITLQHSKVNSNTLLNTASWPDLPKMQNLRNGNQKLQTIAKNVPQGYNRTLRTEQSQRETNISIKTHTKSSENGTLQSTHCAEKNVTISHSECGTNIARTSNKNKGDREKGGSFCKVKRNCNSDVNQNISENVTSDLSKCSSSDGRRRQQAKKRDLAKEEKKRIREAEILRNRVAPKGQSVRVINHKVLEMVLKSDKHSISVNNRPRCEIAELNFPTLEEATKKVKSKSPTEIVLNSPGNSESGTTENNVAISSAASKRRKHKEPLEIDIHNLIKDSSKKSFDKSSKVDKGPTPHAKNKSKRHTMPYLGNQLDSANPERKRGKKREKPKRKRMTTLKTAILEARAIRRHLQELEEQSKNYAGLSEIKFIQEEFNRPINSELHHKCEVLGTVDASQNDKRMECEKNENKTLKQKLIHGADVVVPELVTKMQNVLHLNSSEDASNLVQDKLLSSKAAVGGNEVIDENNEENLSMLMEQVKLSINTVPKHSRKFREFCDHMLTKDLDKAVKNLIENIVKFQDRLYQRDPIKAFAKRRYVVGFREVKKYLKLKKLKLIIIAPDLEIAKNKGGTDDAVAELKDMASLQCVPYVFALNRRALGYITYKKVPVSSIGVVNYEGTENSFEAIIEALAVARMEYSKLLNEKSETIPEKEDHGEADEKVEVSNVIAASLLSKLRDKPMEDKTPPFLAAIEKVACEECSD